MHVNGRACISLIMAVEYYLSAVVLSGFSVVQLSVGISVCAVACKECYKYDVYIFTSSFMVSSSSTVFGH